MSRSEGLWRIVPGCSAAYTGEVGDHAMLKGAGVAFVTKLFTGLFVAAKQDVGAVAFDIGNPVHNLKDKSTTQMFLVISS